ncbi:hydrogen peroxide-inducible genes activator [Marinimicrobium sp. ABcell2]|uniref:hydrogen peroxide-inducible genes activator n=1 Tax=Marinimicrobium sp. ABcell2 TaxID=3069751 RepID=UPI0027B170F6|nr:hydrogen peroxide-inducible genes activator [Marinimicrobium sp. ABcell2]MDQ2075967.1 hydrogen peroxide-inducible genes activator [Marinimicrobium sp. ABcell2]
MTLTDLRYLEALADQGHFGRAAAQCCVGQSTLSMAIRRLESELDIVLFERSPAGIRATPEGERILAHARCALTHADTIISLAANSTNPLAEPMTLGAPSTIAPYFFPLMLPHLRQLSEDPQVYLEEDDGAALKRKLANGEVDALLVSLPFQHPDIVTRPLFDEPLVVLMPSRHALASRVSVPPEALANQKVLLPDPGDCLREHILAACPELRDRVESSQDRSLTHGSTLETLRHMVACGLGLAVVPISAVSLGLQMPGTLYRPFIGPGVHRTLGLAWRASFPRHEAIDALIEALLACNPAYWLDPIESPSGVFVENQYW